MTIIFLSQINVRLNTNSPVGNKRPYDWRWKTQPFHSDFKESNIISPLLFLRRKAEVKKSKTQIADVAQKAANLKWT